MTASCIHKHNVGVTERLVVPDLGEVGVETEGPSLVIILQLLISEGVVLRILSGKVFLLADPVMAIF